jgi:type IV secretory pathway VirB4 component
MKVLKANSGTQSTQRFIEIAEIKEDVVVMKDGTLRVVLLVSSINFSLKSEDEQTAIIQGYQSFLNSLDFPLQIVIQSRQLNIQSYLDKLGELEKNQTNDLLKMQTTEYKQFIRELVELGEIMGKRFYVVVQYDPSSDKQKGFMSRAKEVLRPTSIIRLSQERFRQRRHELMQRVEHVIGGLNSLSLEVAVLDTQSLIELYYNTYNPEIAKIAPLADVTTLQVEDQASFQK